MFTLQDLRDSKIYIDLDYLADLINYNGLSLTVPRTDTGEISLPYALGLIFGLQEYPHSDDFYYLVDAIPANYRPQFIKCWEALEMEVEEDLVEWSERVGTAETVDRIRSLAKQIKLS